MPRPSLLNSKPSLDWLECAAADSGHHDPVCWTPNPILIDFWMSFAANPACQDQVCWTPSPALINFCVLQLIQHTKTKFAELQAQSWLTWMCCSWFRTPRPNLLNSKPNLDCLECAAADSAHQDQVCWAPSPILIDVNVLQLIQHTKTKFAELQAQSWSSWTCCIWFNMPRLSLLHSKPNLDRLERSAADSKCQD
jgi:hypothetical protein